MSDKPLERDQWYTEVIDGRGRWHPILIDKVRHSGESMVKAQLEEMFPTEVSMSEVDKIIRADVTAVAMDMMGVKYVKLNTYDPQKKKIVLVGRVYGDMSFHKEVEAKHFMRICQGYGIQEVVVEKLVEIGIKTIILHTSDGGMLCSKLKDWLEPDIRVMDFGAGKQRFLPVKRMRRMA